MDGIYFLLLLGVNFLLQRDIDSQEHSQEQQGRKGENYFNIMALVLEAQAQLSDCHVLFYIRSRFKVIIYFTSGRQICKGHPMYFTKNQHRWHYLERKITLSKKITN